MLSELPIALDATVPFWILDIKRDFPDSESRWRRFQERREYLLNQIAEKGDNILFRSQKKGETAKAFNALAETIAFLSFAPGGVKVFGRHWESDPGVGGNIAEIAMHIHTALSAIQNMTDVLTKGEKS